MNGEAEAVLLDARPDRRHAQVRKMGRAISEVYEVGPLRGESLSATSFARISAGPEALLQFGATNRSRSDPSIGRFC